ncbi:MAG: UDP-glucose 4-epimerase GalE [Gemmatimonadales bacterium]|nr:UDP-glucose 4-epimerase GalE [Gemmatimonadales bacterium]
MTRDVLVTGGAGYIGSVIVDQLIELGWGVVVADNLSRGHRAAIAPQATFVHTDVGDRAAVSALLRDRPVEAIIHLAAFALVAESVREPAKYRANNVTAARVLLECAVAAGIRRFVFSSSCAVYGHPARVPITEDSAPAPVNPYGETKRDAERLLAEFGERDGLASVSLRYFNAAGATASRGEDHDPETHLIPNVLGVARDGGDGVEVFGTDYPTLDGTAVRDYIHVADIADAHVRALDVPLDGLGPLALNLGTGTGHSVRDVVAAARAITGAPLPILARPRRPGDPPALVAAMGRAAATLGWRPVRSSLDDILRSAWDWHQSHPRGYRG